MPEVKQIIRRALEAAAPAREELARVLAGEPPVCVACVGDRTNPDGGPCLRCKGTGRDPDPLAPVWPGNPMTALRPGGAR
jgi:hypothetical protein